MMIQRILTGLALVQLCSMAVAQTRPISTPVVDLPRGAVTRISSPDKKWGLIFECPNNCSERRLSIEHNATHQCRFISEYERSLKVSWSPDSRSFFVDDDSGSNIAMSYVYDPLTLRVTDLADSLTTRDKGAAQYLRAGHSYLRAKRWINSHELFVSLSGHFDEPPPRGFTVKYRISLDGTVRKISESPEEE